VVGEFQSLKQLVRKVDVLVWTAVVKR
jgi:hypothetical protein